MSHVSVSECCQELAEANAKPLEGSYPNHSKSIYLLLASQLLPLHVLLLVAETLQCSKGGYSE